MRFLLLDGGLYRSICQVASPTEYSRFVVGYHGCDASTAEKALLGKGALQPSENAYDWLGRGIYFWEQGPARAFQFAVNEAARNPKKIKSPDVLGPYIYLGNCLDLLDIRYTEALADVFPVFEAKMRAQGLPLPKNSAPRSDGTKLFHYLDCAVIEYAIKTWNEDFDTVRGVFLEGDPIFEGSEIREQSHIQIAVRNPNCIMGYFKPTALTLP